LPPRSFILHVLFLVDVAGNPFEHNEPLRRLHTVANAPIFGYGASELGLGPIGGRLYQDSEIGVQAARTAIRILRGENPGNIPVLELEATTPVYDWRELRRWGISESRLPPGSIVRYRELTFWQQYRWRIVGVGLFCLVQTALIISLLINRVKRRQSEVETTLIADISTKFVNLPAGEVDNQILDAQRRICELLDLDLLILWQLSGESPGCFSATHFYSAQQDLRSSESLRDEDYPWFKQELVAGRIARFSSLEELPAEAARDRESFRQLGAKSNLSLPLLVGGGPLIGAFCLNATRAERDWPDALVKRLQLVAQIFANALARKRADQERIESEERMTLAAEAAEFGVWGWNIDRNQVWGTERWQRMFGFVSVEDLSFEQVLQRIHPDDRELVEREVRHALVNGRNYAGEFRVVLPDGTEHWIASRGRVDKVASGKPARMRGAAVDITARKQTQEVLARLQRRQELILDSAAEGILGLDLQGNHIFVNAAAARMLGYEAEELLGRHSHSLWHHTRPDGSPYPVEECKVYAAYVDGKVHREFNEVFWRKDGTSFPVEYASTPIYEQGRLLGAVVTFEDITERKRIEDQVRQLSLAVEQGPVSVVITDLRGSMIYVNRKFTEASGYSVAECIGQNPRILKSGESPPAVYKELWACITSGRTWRGEFHNRKKSGELYWEWAVISPLLDSAGKITHFVGVKEDITERKRAEAELLRQQAELAHIARVSTMGELAASVAHELNQPLGAILANAEAAELFLEQEPPVLDEVRTILSAIRKDDERAAEVIRRMRALLRKHELERQPLEINPVVKEVLKLVNGNAGLRGISLAADLDPALPKISGDRVYLQQVVLNLILNGMDAVADQPSEKRQISVRTRLSTAGHVELAVIDSGHGIEPAKLPRLFEPFFTTKPHGMGMGLNIARTIIEAHHGRIWAENNASGGATFQIALPPSGEDLSARPDSASATPRSEH